MVRSAATVVENNFSKGLITEATAMNYPENSVVATDNCIYSKNGKVIRRYGIDYETNYQINSFSTLGIYSGASIPSDLYDSVAIKEFEWTTVNNDGNTSFVVLQTGNILSFYKTSSDNQISNRLKSFDVDLTDYQIPVYADDDGQYVGSIEASFAAGFGYLFVVHPLCDPIYIEYDPTADTISAVAIEIKVRDFERLDDSLDIDERPNSLSDLHKYNLYNQGWYAVAKNATPGTGIVLNYWDNERTDFPSNADIWYLFKDASEILDSDLFDTMSLGNTPAPNGHFIYNAFDIDRDTALGVSGLPAVSSGDYRPSQTAFFNGRVWYAGVQSTGYGSKIYFSKLIEGADDFGKCYQSADPTSEFNADLLPTDGGVINIPDIAIVLTMVPVSSSLFIFASNGIWSITGPAGVFTANDYSVTKISNASISAPNSVVVAEGTPLWWDKAGIYSMVFDPTSGRETVQNISENTIQQLINDIPENNVRYVKGVYNTIDKNIHWIYKTETPETVLENYLYDRVLVFNLPSQSFSLNSLTGTPAIAGLVFTTYSSNDPLVNVSGASLVKYITVGPIGTSDAMAVTVSQFNNSDYYDWVTYDDTGIDAESYFISGYRIRGELIRKFQSNYIVVIMETEDNASAFVQGIWDYSNTSDNGRFTTMQQAYRDDTSYDYSRAKLKMRGNGYSLQLKFISEAGKPFTIIGWSTADTGVNVP